MSGESVRAWLANYLQPLLPDTWRPIVPNARDVDEVDAVTVVLKHTRMTRLPEAPQGNLLHDVVVTVISPFKEVASAEDDLDEAVTELVTALDASPSIRWQSAEKARTVTDGWAWDITCQVITSEPTPDPETPEE